jgi:hypothetical protein
MDLLFNLINRLFLRYFYWLILAVLLIMVIYRIGFHTSVPCFNEEAMKSLMPN